MSPGQGSGSLPAINSNLQVASTPLAPIGAQSREVPFQPLTFPASQTSACPGSDRVLSHPKTFGSPGGCWYILAIAEEGAGTPFHPSFELQEITALILNLKTSPDLVGRE